MLISKPPDIVAQLESQMIVHSLPLWSSEAWNSRPSSFVERLDLNGRADREALRRVARSSATQIILLQSSAAGADKFC